jgi:probable F420-dependent oxidoreductase
VRPRPDGSTAPPYGAPVTRPCRLGIQLPEVEREVRWPEYVALAQAAETAGFDSVWVGDHLLYRGDGRAERGPWDAWTLLSGLASVTTRVRLGPLVACVAFHPPGVLARMASTVDEVSDGRLVLGIGAGWNETEFRAFGIPFDRRASRFEEGLEIVRRLIAGERVTFRGRFHDVDGAVLLPSPAHRIPIMIGSTGERVLRAALPHVDVWNTWFDWYGNTPDGFTLANAAIDRALVSVGRSAGDVERSACVLVVLDRLANERPFEEGVVPLEGSADRIARGVRDMAEAGADEVILVVTPITERSVHHLAEVVAMLDD